MYLTLRAVSWRKTCIIISHVWKPSCRTPLMPKCSALYTKWTWCRKTREIWWALPIILYTHIIVRFFVTCTSCFFLWYHVYTIIRNFPAVVFFCCVVVSKRVSFLSLQIFKEREEDLKRLSRPLACTCFRTSIWDETLYKVVTLTGFILTC